jgi:hypothetical protein
VFEHREREFGDVFGVFNDSLPDGWGLEGGEESDGGCEVFDDDADVVQSLDRHVIASLAAFAMVLLGVFRPG